MPERSDGYDSGSEQSAGGRSPTANRRRLIAAAASGVTGALAGCTAVFGGDGGDGNEGGGGGGSGENDSNDSGGSGDFEGETLRVIVWSGNYADNFEETIKPMFEEATGATLRVKRGWSEILAKIKSAPEDDPPYDVAITEGQFYYLGRQQDLFLPIRTENVPNLENVMSFYRDFRTTEFGVPVDGAPCTIIYRDDAEVDPTSWDDFATLQENSGNGVGIDSGFWVFPMHAAAIGMDEKERAEEVYDESTHDELIDYLDSWQISGWATSGEDIWQQFENGVIDAAQWYFEQTEYDIDDHENLSHHAPETNTGFVNHWTVVRGTDKRRLAEEFLNFLLAADTQTEWSKNSPTLFTNQNMEYAGDLGEQLPRNSDEASKIVFPDWAYLADHQKKFSNAFKEMQTDS